MDKIWKRIGEINTRLAEIARSAEAEGREFTNEEQAEINSLTREKSWRTTMLQAGPAYSGGMEREAEHRSLESMIREAVSKGGLQTIPLFRAEGDGGASGGTQTPPTPTTTTPTPVTIVTADAVSGAIVPLTVGEIIKPLVEGVIYNKIGIRMPTGLAGDYVWPVVGSTLKAEFVGEGVALTAQGIDLDKISANKQRLGVTVELTRESIFQSRGLIEQLVREQIGEVFPVALNEVILGGSTKGNLKSPFSTAKCVKKTIAAIGSGTMKELAKIKAEKLNAGYSSAGMVWVMDEGTKAELECTPRDAGSGMMLVENDRLLGLPIFCSHVMNGKIGLGDFRYQVCGQFGDFSFIVDPITKAKEDKICLTLNGYFSTTTLREDAFTLITITPAA